MLNGKDIRIDTFTYAIKNSEIHMKLTHIPTGVSVKDSGLSMRRLRETLMRRLNDKINSDIDLLGEYEG